MPLRLFLHFSLSVSSISRDTRVFQRTKEQARIWWMRGLETRDCNFPQNTVRKILKAKQGIKKQDGALLVSIGPLLLPEKLPKSLSIITSLLPADRTQQTKERSLLTHTCIASPGSGSLLPWTKKPWNVSPMVSCLARQTPPVKPWLGDSGGVVNVIERWSAALDVQIDAGVLINARTHTPRLVEAWQLCW